MSRVRQVRCLGVEFKEVLIPKPKADVALACLTLVPLLHLTGPQSSHLYSGDNTNLTSQGCSFINFSKKKKKNYGALTCTKLSSRVIMEIWPRTKWFLLSSGRDTHQTHYI
jgi:hypothetical protein